MDNQYSFLIACLMAILTVIIPGFMILDEFVFELKNPSESQSRLSTPV
jgi:hypothetical protein